MSLANKLRSQRITDMKNEVQSPVPVGPSMKSKSIVRVKTTKLVETDIIDGEFVEEADPQAGALTASPPSVIALINRVLDLKKFRPHHFRPSMLFGCDRQNFFYYTHAPFHPQRQENRMVRILDEGTAIHEVVQKYLGDHPEVWFVPEARVYVEVNGMLVRGSCDGIFIRRSDMYRWGLEIKTINDKNFTALKKALPKHIAQASIYAKLNGVEWMTILYWNKNNQDLKEFHVHINRDIWGEVEKRVNHMKRFIDKKILPQYNAKTCTPDFCEHVDICRHKGAPV